MVKKTTNYFVILAILLLISCNNESSIDKIKNIHISNKLITLKIHAWSGYVQEHINDFELYMKNKFNLNVKLIVTKTSGLDSFIKAVNKDNVHLISPANDLLIPLINKKLIIPVNIDKIKKFKQINPVFLKKGVHKVEGIVYAIPFTYGPYAIAYNKNIIPKPKTYKELWNKRYKKRVSISADYDTANIYMTALMLGYSPKNLFNLNEVQLNEIENKLSELVKDQIIEFWEDNLNPKNHNNFDIGTDWGIGVNRINKKYGGNWDIAIPNEGVTAFIDCWVITKNTSDVLTEKVAYEFVNYMISPKIQAKVAKITSYAPVNPYAGRYLNAEEKKEYYLTDPKIFEKFILWRPLNKDVLQKYQQLWERVKNAK